MKERPILFSTDMVRGILDDKKTQTRKIVNHKSLLHDQVEFDSVTWYSDRSTEYRFIMDDLSWQIDIQCPYGDSGDALWVRETYFDTRPYKHTPFFCADPDFLYRADKANIGCHPWKPSIHMPRSAARIFLRITDIKVERLNDITEEDAIAEGVAPINNLNMEQRVHNYNNPSNPHPWSHREGFMELWDSINFKRASWESNPWVWVITFERIRPMITDKQILNLKKGDKLIFHRSGGVLSTKKGRVFTFSNWHDDSVLLPQPHTYWQCEELLARGNHLHNFLIYDTEVFDPGIHTEYELVDEEILRNDHREFVKKFGA